MQIRSAVIWTFALLSLMGGILLSVNGRVERPDRDIIDTYHVLAGVRYEPKATVIAAMDDAALNLYPNTPLVFWGPYFALAIERLKEAGAAAVALDIFFAITPEQWLRTLTDLQSIPPELFDYDQTFDQALAEGRVILAANPIHGASGAFVPLPAKEYLAALPNHLGSVGLTILLKDTDARIRRMALAFEGTAASEFSSPNGYQAPNPWWTLSALAVKEAFGLDALPQSHAPSLFAPQRIAYCGPPGTIPRISMVSLLRKQGLTVEEQALVAGRIVFVGSDSQSFGDHQPTPYSKNVFGREYRDMSGVEIHSNIAETILHPNRNQPLPLVAVFTLWGLIMAMAAVACELQIKPMAVYVMKATSLLILWPLGFVTFLHGYMLPQAGCYSAIMLFFIIIAILRTMGSHQRTTSIVARTFLRHMYQKAND